MLVIALDGAAPQWVFDRWLDVLPRLRSLTERGTFGGSGAAIHPSRCRRGLR
jgi:predicted AlkP superfamily phosphohydrolase/phosphomutase